MQSIPLTDHEVRKMNESDIHVIYGSQNIQRMAYELMDAMDVAAELGKDARIALKPNFAVSKPADSGATTHPEVAEGVLQYLIERGFHNISIMEGSWAGADTKTSFRVCGYEALAKQYGIPLYDLKQDSFVERQAGGLTLKVCRKPLLETDYLINLPVLKAHCQTNLTCALKNLKGCIPDSEKRRFHSLGLMKPIACLSKILRPNLTIVDAICGDLTFEEGGHPVPMDRLIGGVDPVLLDSYGAELLGFSVEDIGYLPLAERLGVGSTDVTRATIHEHHAEKKQQTLFQASGVARELAGHVVADSACSVCYGSLIHALQRLRENGKRLPAAVHIGQGFRGKSGNGIGIGNCTAGFARYLKGCPPTAKAMADFLAREMIRITVKNL